jgi:hypothetical protein
MICPAEPFAAGRIYRIEVPAMSLTVNPAPPEVRPINSAAPVKYLPAPSVLNFCHVGVVTEQ